MTAAEKILIVDDELELLSSLRSALEIQGYVVFTAQNGAEALEIAKKELPDLILLDLMMPKLDGYKVCRLLKFDGRYRGIAVLILSARVQEEDLLLAEECGADAYLTKPFDTGRLIREIRRLLEESKNPEVGSLPKVLRQLT